MRNIETPNTARTRLKFEKGYHYVKCEHGVGDFEGASSLDMLLDMEDSDGGQLYEVVVDGKNPNERQRAGGGRRVILRCPQEEFDKVQAGYQKAANYQAQAIAGQTGEGFSVQDQLPDQALQTLGSAVKFDPSSLLA